MNLEFTVSKDDYDHAGMASSQIKKFLKQVGLPIAVLKRVAIACYEAEINLVIHSDGGNIMMELDDEGNVSLHFDDCGPGIENLELALTPGYSTANQKAQSMGFGAGMGLVNMKRVANEFDIQSSPEGTHIQMKFYE